MDLRIVTTDRRQFTLFYLFHFSFFFFVFYLHVCVFGSHFRSHDDSHVTEERMVELGGHFFFVVFLQEQTVLRRTRTRTLHI